MNQIEEALTGLISKDPAIVNENANKDSSKFFNNERFNSRYWFLNLTH